MSEWQPIETANDMIHRMKTEKGLTEQEAKMFVTLLHKLDRIRLAEVSGYALGLASMPRHTVITEFPLMPLPKPPTDGEKSKTEGER